jgi:hypothetical protein
MKWTLLLSRSEVVRMLSVGKGIDAVEKMFRQNFAI